MMCLSVLCPISKFLDLADLVWTYLTRMDPQLNVNQSERSVRPAKHGNLVRDEQHDYPSHTRLYMSSKMMVKMLKWAVTANRMIHPVHGPIEKNNNKKTVRSTTPHSDKTKK